MIRISTVIWLSLSVATGTALFNISQKTENERHQIAWLNQKIAQEKESLTVLKAEWSYLNQPSRLRDLAEKHLDLETIKNLPVVSRGEISLVDDIPPPLPADTIPEEIEDIAVSAQAPKPALKREEPTTAELPVVAPTPAPKPNFQRPQKVTPVFAKDEPAPQKTKQRIVKTQKKITNSRDFNDVLKGLN